MNFKSNLKSFIMSIPLYASYRQQQLNKKHEKITENEQKMIDFYRQFIQPSSLCFDVGANLGNRVKIFTALGGHVIAFEPQQQCIRYLDLIYRNDPNVIVVPKAVGERMGEMEMLVSTSSTTSSLSPDWVQSVQQSKRFGERTWGNREVIQLTTLDAAIMEYGLPDFCKIDVEGFEDKVLAGLSQPLRYLSFEFTPEFYESTSACLQKLETLGAVEFNYSLGESMEFSLSEWLTGTEFRARFESQIRKDISFGDIYARFTNNLVSK